LTYWTGGSSGYAYKVWYGGCDYWSASVYATFAESTDAWGNDILVATGDKINITDDNA